MKTIHHLLATALCLFATLAFSADYTVTTTPTSITVTDTAGNGEILAISQPSEGNIQFAATGRTFSVDGGGDISGNSGSVSLTGITSITVNAGAGTDSINVGAFTGTLPSLTLNGGTGNDTVNLDGDITFVANANLDVDLQNDVATPGADTVVIDVNTHLIASGTDRLRHRLDHDQGEQECGHESR